MKPKFKWLQTGRQIEAFRHCFAWFEPAQAFLRLRIVFPMTDDQPEIGEYVAELASFWGLGRIFRSRLDSYRDKIPYVGWWEDHKDDLAEYLDLPFLKEPQSPEILYRKITFDGNGKILSESVRRF